MTATGGAVAKACLPHARRSSDPDWSRVAGRGLQGEDMDTKHAQGQKPDGPAADHPVGRPCPHDCTHRYLTARGMARHLRTEHDSGGIV